MYNICIVEDDCIEYFIHPFININNYNISLFDNLNLLSDNTPTVIRIPLHLYNMYIDKMPDLPVNLYITQNNIDILYNLPKKVVYLTFFNVYLNNLNEYPEFPESLKSLFIHNCSLTQLPNLKHTQLMRLECIDNKYLFSLPILPNTLQYLVCTNNNNLSILPNLMECYQLRICDFIMNNFSDEINMIINDDKLNHVQKIKKLNANGLLMYDNSFFLK